LSLKNERDFIPSAFPHGKDTFSTHAAVRTPPRDPANSRTKTNKNEHVRTKMERKWNENGTKMERKWNKTEQHGLFGFRMFANRFFSPDVDVSSHTGSPQAGPAAPPTWHGTITRLLVRALACWQC
jgi:hypothetical protein